MGFIGTALIAIGKFVTVGKAAGAVAGLIGGAVLAGAGLVAKGVMNIFEIEMPKVDTDGSRQRTVRGTTEPRKLVYGEALVSGPITFIGVTGDDNEDLYQIIALASHEVEDITDVHFDDVVIPNADINSGADGGGAVGGSGIFQQQNGEDIVIINKFYGTDTQTAWFPAQVAFTNYTSNHKGLGVAYIGMRWRLNEDSQETWDKYSPNNVKALVKGKKIYDPRLDSTQLDIPGSGTHRLADTTTWEYSSNPALCVADYLMDSNFGLGISSAKIDWVAVASAADSCDTTVSIPDEFGGSTTEKRFTCNGVIFGTDTHRRNISKILSSMNGTLTYVNGEYIIRAGVFENPSVSLDDDDLTGPVSIKTSFERGDRFNTIKGIFIDPDQNHKNTEFPKVTITDAVTRDNGEVLEKEIQLPMTNSSYMAQRIANKLIQQSDNQKVITLPVNLTGLNVRVGDRVNVSLSDLDWTNQVYECVGWNFNEEGGVTLTLRQDDEFSYSDLAVVGYSTISATGDITPGFAGVPSPSGLTATAGLKNIELNWTNPAKIDRVREIIVYASANNQWSSAQEIGRTLGTQFIHDASNGTDSISVGDQRYYWIRSVGNSTGLLSDRNPDSDTSTIQATCGENASGQQLTTGAVLGFDLFDTDNTTVMGTTDVKNQVTVNIEDENNVILQTELGDNLLTQVVGDVGLTVYTEVTDLGAQYSLKIDAAGRIAGFGLSSTLPTNTTDPAFSEFTILADKFKIVDPSSPSDDPFLPFVVTADKIEMNTDVRISGDLVTLGTISAERLQIDNITLDTDGSGNLIIKQDGVTSLQIAASAVGNTQLAGDAVSKDKFQADVNPVELGATLPATATQGDIFFLTTDNNVYRYNGTSWTKAITLTEVSDAGTLAGLNDINLSYVTDAGILAGLNDIDLTYVTDAGALAALNDIDLSKVTDAGALAALSGIDLSYVSDAGDLAGLSVITSDYIAANAVIAGKIAAGAISTDKLAANSVTASKIAVVGRGAALNSDPNCTDSAAWTKYFGSDAIFTTITDGIVGNNVIRTGTPGTNGSWYNGNRIALDPNKTYRMTVVARKDSAADGTFYAGVAAFQADGTNITGDGAQWSYAAAANNAGSTTFTRYTMEFGAGTSDTFPSNAVTFAPVVILNYDSTAGYFEAQDIRIEEKVPASLIVDGTITADQIASNTITSAEIAANTITSSQIAANTITAGEIAAGAIGATEISVTNLAAISADLGTVTAGSLSATLITGDVTEKYAYSYSDAVTTLSGSSTTLHDFVIPGPTGGISKRGLANITAEFSLSRAGGTGNDEVVIDCTLFRKSKGQSSILIGTVAAVSGSGSKRTIQISGDVTDQIGHYGACDSASDGSSIIDYRFIDSVWFDGNYTNIQLFRISGTDSWSVSDNVYYSADAFDTGTTTYYAFGRFSDSKYVIAGGNTQFMTIPIIGYFGKATDLTTLRLRAEISSGATNSTVIFYKTQGVLENTR